MEDKNLISEGVIGDWTIGVNKKDSANAQNI